jgi:hypothetical protein
VSVACARGAGPELIAQRFAQCAIEGDELVLPSHSGATGTVRADRALALQPLVAPTSAGDWTDDYADVCLSIRYAAPGAWRVARVRRRRRDAARLARGALGPAAGADPPPPRPPGQLRRTGGAAERLDHGLNAWLEEQAAAAARGEFVAAFTGVLTSRRRRARR